MDRVKQWLGKKAEAAAIALGGFGLAADMSGVLPPGGIFDELMWAVIVFLTTRLIKFARWAR